MLSGRLPPPSALESPAMLAKVRPEHETAHLLTGRQYSPGPYGETRPLGRGSS